VPGLIDSTQGLEYGSGLNWLEGGLGGPGEVNPPSSEMITEAGIEMVTEADEFMVTE
jgi:hypothetical protein